MSGQSKPAHSCESWQMLENADGGRYCGACGVSEVPSVLDLLGIAPDWTSGMSTDEWMDEQRGRP